MTPACAVQNIQRLCRNVLPDCIPSPEEIPDYAADWCATLPDVTDAQLSAAVVAWLRDPARGRYWPGVADLAERIPGMTSAARTLDADERAWETILADVALGAYRADPSERVGWEEITDEAGVRRMQPRAKQTALESLLTPSQRRALADCGGAFAIRRAGIGETNPEIARATLRKRFLALARTEATAPLAIPESPRAGAFPLPPSVAAFLGTGESPRDAATRARTLERAREDR